MKSLKINICAVILLLAHQVSAFADTQAAVRLPSAITGRKTQRSCPRAYPDPDCHSDGHYYSSPYQEEQNALYKADDKCQEMAFALLGQYYTYQVYRVSPWTYPAPEEATSSFVCVYQ